MKKITLILLLLFTFPIRHYSQKRVLLSEIIDTVFCRQIKFQELGYNKNRGLYLEKSSHDAKEVSKIIVWDSPSIKCYEFKNGFDDSDLAVGLKEHQYISILSLAIKKKNRKYAEILINSRNLDQEIYELNRKSKIKVFSSDDEWVVIIKKMEGRWTISSIIGSVYEGREQQKKKIHQPKE